MTTRTRSRPRIGRTASTTTGGRFSRAGASTPRARAISRTTTAIPRMRAKSSRGGLRGLLGALPSMVTGSRRGRSSRGGLMGRSRRSSKRSSAGGTKSRSAIALLATGAAGFLGSKQMQKRRGSHRVDVMTPPAPGNPPSPYAPGGMTPGGSDTIP